MSITVNTTADTAMCVAALTYAAERHWQVFPAHASGEKKSHKSAEYSNGQNWGKTIDSEEIRRDFRRWPRANIGIATGPDSGIFVVEADTPEGHDVNGIASLKKLEAEHGPLPTTLMAESPSGSLHYYFKWPVGMTIRNGTSKIAPGVDQRGEGGMVIAPPSMRPGKGRYKLLNEGTPIADATGWLIALATAGEGDEEHVPGTEPESDPALVAAALAVIPNNDLGWEEWNNVGMKVWRATGGDGFEAFDSWSRKSDKHDAQETLRRWNHYFKSPPNQGGAGTIFYMANEASPGWQADYDADLEAAIAKANREAVAPFASGPGVDGKPQLVIPGAEKRSSNAAPSHPGHRRSEQIARNIEIGDDVTEPIFPAIMTLAEMHDRLVFVGGSGAVVDRATGRVRKKETATDEYAASRHSYKTKDDTPKEKEGPALKFWIASRKRVTVDVLAWVPGAPEICRPPEATDGAATAFNSWRGIAPMDAPEDWEVRATPFLDHVAFLVPNQDERRLYLQWLAHIVQRPEVLPHTAYLMTTQTTGIGRNLMASIIVRVLRGHVAAGVSLPELLDGGFTGRLSRKLLAIVDEAREGSGERRYQRAERLKSLITEAHRHVNHKYGLQSVEKNCCRWLMFSNHRDAIPFDNSDRRIHVIENPTVRKEPEYYERLFGLLDDTSFIASVWRRLETLDIASFRPGAHATVNPAKLHALREMMSETERAVFEFKEDCKTELTSRTIIRDHVSWIGTVNENHLTHAITRSGMVSTGRRVKITHGPNLISRHSIVIVKGNWTPESVEATAVEVLAKILFPSDK